MKKCVYLSILGLVLAMMGCSEEVSKKNADTSVNLCGNGVLDAGEVCDGSFFASGAKVCPDGLVIKDASAFACTNSCTLDTSDACVNPYCGDGELSADEVCDGSLFKDGTKVCPDNMVELPNAVFGCTEACQIDINQACVDAICGDSRLTGSEPCDGGLIDDAAKVCPDGQKAVVRRNLFTCTSDCTLDSTWACIPNEAPQPTLYFSEIGILRLADDSNVSAHIYIEVGNLGAKTVLSDCKLVGVNLTDDFKIEPSGFVFEYPLSQAADTLGNTASDVHQVIGICYEATTGWLKTQFPEDAKTEAECKAGYSKADDDWRSCCELKGDDLCYTECQDEWLATQYAISKCLKDAAYKQLSESCDFYIPTTESGLNMTYVRESAYKGYYQSSSLWGVALICGDMIQDVLKLDGMNGYGGGDRMCVDDDLSSIKASSDEIRDNYQGYSSSDFLSGASPDRSYGYAKCGTNEVN